MTGPYKEHRVYCQAVESKNPQETNLFCIWENVFCCFYQTFIDRPLMFLHALVQQDKTHLNSIFRLGWKVFGALSRFGGVSSPERKMSEGKRNQSILFHEISMYVSWPALAILKKNHYKNTSVTAR